MQVEMVMKSEVMNQDEKGTPTRARSRRTVEQSLPVESAKLLFAYKLPLPY